MKGKIILGVIIALIFIWIFYIVIKTSYLPAGVFSESYERMVVSAHNKYNKIFKTPAGLYSNIYGYNYDEIAQSAFKKATKRDNMHNINESRGKLSKKNVYDATINSYILGDLYKYSLAPNSKSPQETNHNLTMADMHYKKTLDRILRYPNTLVNHREATHEPAIENMIGRIEANNTEIGNVRDVIRRARVEANKKKSLENRQIKNKEYFEPRKIRSDPQNVHDSAICHDIKSKYDTIVRKNVSDPRYFTIQDIRAAAINNTRATQIINDAETTGASISSLNDSEINVLLNVWKRINSADNISNAGALKESFIDALADSMEKRGDAYHKVCVTGRCSRVIESLTLLDNDNVLSSPIKTEEILREEVFSKAPIIIEAELKKAPKKLRKAYLSANPPDDMTEQIYELEEKLKLKLDEIIRSEYPNVKLSVLNNLILDAQAGI